MKKDVWTILAELMKTGRSGDSYCSVEGCIEYLVFFQRINGCCLYLIPFEDFGLLISECLYLE